MISIFLDRWPTLCTPVDKLEFLLISAQILAMRCAGAVWLFTLNMLTAVKMLVWFTMIFTSSCNSYWAQSHGSPPVLPLCVCHTPQVAAIVATQQSAAVVGLMAAFKALKIHINLTV